MFVKGQIELPDSSAMWADVRRTQAMHEARFRPSVRRYVDVDYIPAMDELAHMIGCLPPNFRQSARLISYLHSYLAYRFSTYNRSICKIVRFSRSKAIFVQLSVSKEVRKFIKQTGSYTAE